MIDTRNVRALPVPETEAYLDRDGIAKLMGVHVASIDRWLRESPPIPSEKWGPSKTSPRRFRPSLCIAWARERGCRRA